MGAITYPWDLSCIFVKGTPADSIKIGSEISQNIVELPS